MTEPRRAEVWWGEAPDADGRPYLILTRDQAVPVLRALLAAPITRRMRGIPTELSLGPAEGLAHECVASMDNVVPFPKALLTRRIGALSPARLWELCAAVNAAVDC